jgi:hypothetical protein
MRGQQNEHGDQMLQSVLPAANLSLISASRNHCRGGDLYGLPGEVGCVILSAAKDLRPAPREILRCAQDDRAKRRMTASGWRLARFKKTSLCRMFTVALGRTRLAPLYTNVCGAASCVSVPDSLLTGSVSAAD